MIAESGPARILEVTRDGKVANQIALNVKKPHPHRDTRLVRVTEQGTYLVCHEGDGLVREYDRSGKTVWEYEIPLFGQQPRDGHGPEAFGNQCFAALRLPSGNTLISTGNGHRVIEVTPQKEIVWQVTAADLKTTLAWSRRYKYCRAATLCWLIAMRAKEIPRFWRSLATNRSYGHSTTSSDLVIH